ncbi:hypothetical protein ASD04_11300 [Devosia sp. Root436]|uniref:hypothetical protein n=1 Tax=Devosia sp. Root436 TaxID=1736537 RepID=UPI0006F4F886|nr:hypothetical protein [Devosia sp. Root436]KQX38198.1 hypothetical protein ASD04_11300 [Devosia sp. Root436]
MGKELSKLRERREVRQRFEEINKRRDMVLVIHYSCESFYDIKDGRTPRVTSIAVRQFASGQTTSFSIHKSAELKGVVQGDISARYDELEKDMLVEFFAYLKTKPDHTFVHWNMRDINYGFLAIEHRFKVLKGKPVTVADDKKFDLARELVAMFGVKYAPHGASGRMHSLMEMNHITAKDALNGKGEAEAFENQEYVKLHQSTLRKADVIANLLDRTLDGSIKTKATWFDLHGFHPVAVIEWITEHWVFAALGIVALLIGLYLGFKDLI